MFTGKGVIMGFNRGTKLGAEKCDYCCWYNERYGNCDCPYVMKKLACDKAKKEKERSEK